MFSDPWPFSAPMPSPDSASASLEAAYARCFAGADGAVVLEHLSKVTLGRVLGPEASDAALRHLEGQRALFALVSSLVRRGRGEEL